MEEKTRKVLFHLFNTKTKGVDTYHHGGSMWLIFTDEKKWVIELTKDGTLWYNHYFFQDCFKYLSLDVVENQHYITEWVEDIIQNGVINTLGGVQKDEHVVEDTIQNGVIHTAVIRGVQTPNVEDTIQNGVRNTKHQLNLSDLTVEETIQNGVIKTTEYRLLIFTPVEDAIQNGVKETTPGGYLGSIEMKGKIVHQFESPKQNNEVENTIQNGVRKIEGEPHDYPHTVANIIKNGVKKIKISPTFTEYGDWLDGDERLDEIIQNGIKETKQEEHHRLREVVQTVKNGIKETRLEQNITEGEIDDIIQNGIKETWGYEKQPQVRVNEVINKGEKTIWNNDTTKL
jgi:hypothetical protein